MSDRFAPVEVVAERIGRTTDKAVLVWVDREKHWLPRSRLLDEDGEPLPESEHPEEGDEDVTLYVPRWLADEKGITGID